MYWKVLTDFHYIVIIHFHFYPINTNFLVELLLEKSTQPADVGWGSFRMTIQYLNTCKSERFLGFYSAFTMPTNVWILTVTIDNSAEIEKHQLLICHTVLSIKASFYTWNCIAVCVSANQKYSFVIIFNIQQLHWLIKNIQKKYTSFLNGPI